MSEIPAFTFNTEFQRKLVKLALIDDSFATIAIRFVEPNMFEADALRWAWSMIKAERKAGRTPTEMVLHNLVPTVQPVLQPRYRAMLEAIGNDVMREDAFIRQQLAEFVQRNMFVAAYNATQREYNAGNAIKAIDMMAAAVDKIRLISFDAPARHWYYDDLDERTRIARMVAENEWDHTFPTGIVGVDEVLDGGLSRGEIGVWIADSKGGKSLFLVHLTGYTCRALQQRTLLVLLEGSYKQTGARLDSWHTGELYAKVKRGEFTAQTWQMMQHEYHMLRQTLVIREMTDNWAYSALDIRAELDELKAQNGWTPEMIICDYGDLLRSDVKAASEEEHQRNAFGALKTMTTQDQGYAIWTASQAQRPKDPWKKKTKKQERAIDEQEREDDETLIKWGKPVLRAQDIADSYNKIRRCDFIGSINRDEEEKEKDLARLWCDRYRDNAASRLVPIKQDLDRMLFVDLTDRLNRPDSPDRLLKKMDRQRKAEQQKKQQELTQ